MNCNQCNKLIERHIFCSRKCNNEFYNKQRYNTSNEINNEIREKSNTSNIEDKKYDTSEPIKKIFKQVLNCKKHHGSSNCGCVQ